MDEWMDLNEWMDGLSVIGAVTTAAAINRLMGWPGPQLGWEWEWGNREEIQECQAKWEACQARLWITEKKLKLEKKLMLEEVEELEEVLEEKNAQIAEMEKEIVLRDEATEVYNKHIYSLEVENEKLRQGYANSAGREINRNRAVARLQDTIEREIYHPYVQGLEAENIQLRQGYANSARREINRNKAVARLEDITERMNAVAGPDSGTIDDQQYQHPSLPSAVTVTSSDNMDMMI